MNTKAFTEIRETYVEFSFKEIDNTDIVKWYATKHINTNGNTTVENNCGVCSKETFDNINSIKYPTSNIEIDKFYENKGYFVAISKENLNNVFSLKSHISEVIEEISEKNIDSSDYEIFIWGSGAHQLMNLQKIFIPLPIHIDYINGNLSDESYNLTDALIKVKNSPYVMNKESIRIKDIPYYNATDWRNAYLDIHVLLPLDLYEKYESCSGYYQRYKMIVEEILNIEPKKEKEMDF